MCKMVFDVNDLGLWICGKILDVEWRCFVCSPHSLFEIRYCLRSWTRLLFSGALEVEQEVELRCNAGCWNRDDVDVVHRQVLRLETVLDGVDRHFRVMLDSDESFFGYVSYD